jgi:hypothetical protein
MHPRRWLAASFVCVLIGACGGKSVIQGASVGDASAPMACVPGQSVACVASSGCAGAQVCAADGSRYEECACFDGGSAPDATTIVTADSGEDDAAIPPPDASTGPGTDSGVDVGSDANIVSDGATDATVVEAGATTHPWGVDVPGGYIGAIAMDSLGDVVAVGDTDTVNGENLTYYVTSIGPNGLQRWTNNLNSGAEFTYHSAIGVAVDGANAVYVTGSTGAALDLGGSTPMGPGNFIVKYDVDGNFLWQMGPFPNASFTPHCAFFAPSGNLVVGGALTGNQDFGGGAITPSSSQDVLLLQVTPAGGFASNAHWGGPGAGYDTLSVCADDVAGNVYLGGRFEGTIDFGGGPMTGAPGGNSSWDIFLAKLDASGAYAAQTHLSTSCDNCGVAGFVPDLAGNVFVAGSIDTTFDLGGGSMQPTGNSGAWLGELDASLGYVWGTVYSDGVYAGFNVLGPTTTGNLIVGATYAGDMSFGCGTLPAPSQGQINAALVELDTSGNCVLNDPFTGGTTSINAILSAAPPDVIMGGSFAGTLPLPSGSLSSHTSQSPSDGFVARLQP